MDFSAFTKTEIDELFNTMASRLPPEALRLAEQEFGGREGWRAHYAEVMARPELQAQYRKMFEWYGGKDAYLGTLRSPLPAEVVQSYQTRLDDILRRLAAQRGCPPDSFAVKQLVGEYGFVTKQLTRIRDERPMLLAAAAGYRGETLAAKVDALYGEGASAFFAEAFEAFCKK